MRQLNRKEIKQMEAIKQMPWYLKDSLGWPIEKIKGRHVHNFVRIVCQNIRKITG